MKTSFKLIPVLAALLLGAPAGATEITLLHVNDTHSHLAPWGPKDLRLRPMLGGLSKAATIIAAEKAADPSALFIHGGDIMQGDFFFSEYLGVYELRLLQQLGLDVMALGNHEFVLGPDFLTAVLNATWPTGGNFPILSTNLDLTDPRVQVLANWVTTDPTLIKDVHGVKVGFFALTTPYDINAIPAPAVLRDDLGDIAEASVAALRGAGAEVVVCIGHLGLDLSEEIAASVPGIDVIVNAHDHVALAIPELVGSTIIVSAGEYYRWVGKLTLDVEDGAVTLAGYDLIDVDRRVPELPEVAAVVSSLEDGIVARYGDVYRHVLALAIGTIPAEADPDRPERDTPIGDLWTDAYRFRTGTDIAVEVDGFLDDPLPNGLVVAADIFRVNSNGLPEIDPAAGTMRVPPFRLATFKLTGAQLIAALEAAIFMGGDVFPQVSGMRFAYDSRKLPGERILLDSVRVNGRRLEPDRLYSVTVNERVLKSLPLLGIPAPVDPVVTAQVGYEAARDLIRARVFLLPCPEGRIRDVARQ